MYLLFCPVVMIITVLIPVAPTLLYPLALYFTSVITSSIYWWITFVCRSPFSSYSLYYCDRLGPFPLDAPRLTWMPCCGVWCNNSSSTSPSIWSLGYNNVSLSTSVWCMTFSINMFSMGSIELAGYRQGWWWIAALELITRNALITVSSSSILVEV